MQQLPTQTPRALVASRPGNNRAERELQKIWKFAAGSRRGSTAPYRGSSKWNGRGVFLLNVGN